MYWSVVWCSGGCSWKCYKTITFGPFWQAAQSLALLTHVHQSAHVKAGKLSPTHHNVVRVSWAHRCHGYTKPVQLSGILHIHWVGWRMVSGVTKPWFSMFSTKFPTEITKKVTFSAFPIAHSPPVFPRRNHLAVQSYTGTHEAHPSVMHGSISLWLVHACNPSPAIHIKPPPLDGPLHTSNQPLHPSWWCPTCGAAKDVECPELIWEKERDHLRKGMAHSQRVPQGCGLGNPWFAFGWTVTPLQNGYKN